VRFSQYAARLGNTVLSKGSVKLILWNFAELHCTRGAVARDAHLVKCRRACSAARHGVAARFDILHLTGAADIGFKPPKAPGRPKAAEFD